MAFVFGYPITRIPPSHGFNSIDGANSFVEYFSFHRLQAPINMKEGFLFVI